MMNATTALPTLIGAVAITLASPARAEDWPQWRGIHRDGKSPETGLLKTWPEGGPKLVWTARELGGGYSTPSVADGRIYGMGYRGEQGRFDPPERSKKNSWPHPIITGGRLYIRDQGILLCYDVTP